MFGSVEFGDRLVRTMIATQRDGVRGDVESRLWQLGEKILTESARIVPVDTGYLRSTRFQQWGANEGSASVVELGYSAEYALWVHEIPASHNGGTRWKFLEEPAIRLFNEATGRAQASARDAWEVFAEAGMA